MACKKLYLVMLFVLPIIAFSQVDFSDKFNVKTGKAYKVIDAPIKLYLPINSESVIAVKVRGELVTLQLLDALKMSEVKRTEYEDFPKYSKLQEIVEINGRLYYFFEAFNKKNDNFTMYYREIDTKNATFGKIIRLFRTKDVVVGTKVDPFEEKTILLPGVKLGPKFKIQKSFDESKIMISYRNKPKVKNDKKNKDIIGVYVFDSELNKLWGKEVRMPYTEAVINNMAYGITSNGTAFMLIFNKESKEYSVLTLSKAGVLKEIELGIDGEKMVQKFKMVEDNDGNLIFTGFYANGIDIKVSVVGSASPSFNTNGILYLEMNKDGVVTVERDFTFSIEFIKEYQLSRKKKKSKKREEKGVAGIEDLQMIDFYVGVDGSSYFVGEQRFARQEFAGLDSKGRVDNDEVIYFNNLVLVKINADGDLDWMRKLPKYQSGKITRGGLGTKYSKVNNKHYFLFLDNPENDGLTINNAPEKYVDGKDGVLTAFIVNDENGDFTRYQILSLDNINGVKGHQFTTSRIISLTDNILLVEVYIKKKKDMLVKLELN